MTTSTGSAPVKSTAVDNVKKDIECLAASDWVTQCGLKKNRSLLDSLLKRRFFIAPAFEIYGGVAGLYDYGPSGCALKAEVEALWRQHFVIEESMLEISGPCVTPHAVLKTSGHVDRFTDAMVTDLVTKDCYRTDKLIEDWVEMQLQNDKNLTAERKSELQLVHATAGAMSLEQLDQTIQKYSITSVNKNQVSKSFPFNLMFRTKIGPKAEDSSLSGVSFLRPETAQGIFVNFKRLLEFNGGKVPFGAAQIGLGFRNEIAPRNGLLRVREFLMAEIEYFVDPLKKRECEKFELIQNMKLPLLTKDNQLKTQEVLNDLTLAEAVEQRLISNETLAYFLARTYLFLLSLGIQKQGIRFRQHMNTEMAHYAEDCWDAEIYMSYGWVEVAGHADRAAFDLTRHSAETKIDLTASRRLAEPKIVDVAKMTLNRPKMGPAFKSEQNTVVSMLESMSFDERMKLENDLAQNGSQKISSPDSGKEYMLTRELVKFEAVQERRVEESYIPSVIEPSFGIGRILYGVLEHTFRIRDGAEERTFLSLPPVIAPTKVSVLPISTNVSFNPLIDTITKSLKMLGLSCKVDNSGASIGKKYARTDEIGIPFGVTIDFQTLQDQTVTLRERDTMDQIRIPISELAQTVHNLSKGLISWKDDVLKNFPLFTEQQV